MFGINLFRNTNINFINKTIIPTIYSIQKNYFSKYISKSRRKRMPLNTKRVGKGYYKGNRCRKEGRLTSKGQFIINKELLTELMVPDLTDFKLKPYIGPGAKRNVV